MIRQFRPSDSRDCSDLIRASIRQDAAIPREAREELLRRESSLSMQERARLFHVAVYELQGRIVGLGGVEMNEIRLLVVAPEFQGRGIGRSILEHLEAMIPAVLFTDIFVYSSPAAEGFYRSQGYLPKGDYVFRISNRALPTIFMIKKL